MTIKDIIYTVLELAAVGFMFWALFNEVIFIELEKKLKSKIKKLWEVIR